jgi:hypothetical protein
MIRRKEQMEKTTMSVVVNNNWFFPGLIELNDNI